MPKKVNQTKADKDFFFFVAISVFAALTIFAASYLNTARSEAIQARQNANQIELAPLDVVSPDDLTPADPPQYQNPTK